MRLLCFDNCPNIVVFQIKQVISNKIEIFQTFSIETDWNMHKNNKHWWPRNYFNEK